MVINARMNIQITSARQIMPTALVIDDSRTEFDPAVSRVGVGGSRLAVAQVERRVAFPCVPEPSNVVQGGGVRPVGGE